MENFDILNSINNPLAWIGMAILVVGSILKLLPIKTLDKAQVERLLHKFLNSLILCGFIAAAFGIYFSKPENGPVVLTHELTPPDINELNHSICNELRGEYRLRQKYTFVEKKDIRLIARKGIWHANKCRFLEKNKISLAGSDTTDFDIEVVINNEFKHIATGTFSYPSYVLIQNGKLINRSFHLAIEEGRRLKCINEADGQTCHGIEKSVINNKINEAIDIRNTAHERLTKKYCIPTNGEEAGVRVLAFVCSNYTRVMKLWYSD